MKKFSLLTLGLLALCTISTMAQSYQSKMERYGGLITEGRFWKRVSCSLTQIQFHLLSNFISKYWQQSPKIKIVWQSA